jgi:hypothetical protein
MKNQDLVLIWRQILAILGFFFPIFGKGPEVEKSAGLNPRQSSA